MAWHKILLEAKACKFRYLFNINEGLVLLKLAGTVLILSNTGPGNVNFITIYDNTEAISVPSVAQK